MLTFDKPVIYYFVIALAAFLTGFSKAGFGGTLGVLITPMVSMVMPANQAIGLLLPILLLGDTFGLAAHWRRWDMHLLRALLPGALLGVTLGTFVLTSITPLVLKRSLAVLVILFIIYKLFEKRIFSSLRLKGNNLLGIGAGTLAGFTSTLAHSGGPPITIYLLTQKVTPRTFIATSIIFFTLMNLIKVPYYWVAGLFDWGSLLQIAWLLPAVPFGAWLGRRLSQHIPKETFDRVILVLLVVSVYFLLR